jgi:carboxylesterase type B
MPGLFHRAISESGSALNPWAYQTPDSSVKLAFELGEEFGAKTADPGKVLEVLKAVEPEKLVQFLSTGLLQVSSINDSFYVPPNLWMTVSSYWKCVKSYYDRLF